MRSVLFILTTATCNTDGVHKLQWPQQRSAHLTELERRLLCLAIWKTPGERKPALQIEICPFKHENLISATRQLDFTSSVPASRAEQGLHTGVGRPAVRLGVFTVPAPQVHRGSQAALRHSGLHPRPRPRAPTAACVHLSPHGQPLPVPLPVSATFASQG